MTASCGMRARRTRISREHRRADEREREADPVDDRRVRVAGRDRHQQRDRPAERRNLRQRQVDEDDAALHDVDAEIRMNAGEDEAGDERRRQELEHRRVHVYLPAPVRLIASTSRLIS